jgi:hypothetical protein
VNLVPNTKARCGLRSTQVWGIGAMRFPSSFTTCPSHHPCRRLLASLVNSKHPQRNIQPPHHHASSWLLLAGLIMKPTLLPYPYLKQGSCTIQVHRTSSLFLLFDNQRPCWCLKSSVLLSSPATAIATTITRILKPMRPPTRRRQPLAWSV